MNHNKNCDIIKKLLLSGLAMTIICGFKKEPMFIKLKREKPHY